MTISYSVSSNPSLSNDRYVGITSSFWYTDAICGIELLDSQNDSAKSITIRVKKPNSTSLGQAKLVARLYKAKPYPANYPQPYLFDTSGTNPEKYGLAVSNEVMLEGLINENSFTDVTFTFSTPLVAESGYNGRYVVVIMPAFTGYLASGAIGGNPPNLSTSGFPANTWILIEGTRNPNNPPNTFLTCASWISNSGMSANYYDQMVMQIDGVPANTAPTDILLSASTIAENSPALSVIGSLSVTDAENSPQLYSLVAGAGDTDNDLFEISGSNLRLKSGTSLNYEEQSSYSVRIRATDASDSSYTFEKVFVITVSDVNDSPTSISLSAASIQEKNAVGAEIGVLSAIDPDLGDVVSFSVISGSDKVEAIEEMGVWKLKAKISFDYESGASHLIAIRATDSQGATVDESFTISVVNDLTDDPQSPQNLNILGSKATGVVSYDPRVAPARITISGVVQALPSGSIVRLSSSGQKFVKVDGGELEYTAIYVTPPAEWGWSEEGSDLWEVFQSL